LANGRCRIIPVNALSGLTVGGDTAATGYSNTSLTDDVLAKAWRSSATASSFALRVDRGASPAEYAWVGLFDCVPVTSTVKVTGVVLQDSPDASTTTDLGRFIPNARGDGGVLARLTQRYAHYTIQLSGTSQLDIGLLFAGNPYDLRKTFSRRTQQRDRGVVVNDTEGGGTYAGRLRSYREVLSLDWSALTEEQHLELWGIEDLTGGQYTPLVLIPDTKKPDELYHGRLEEAQQWQQNTPTLWEQHALSFRESGRAG
jgi:hypothetical protein